MKQILKYVEKSCRHKLLATSIAAFCTSVIATSVTQASDIDIYQEAKSGDITLMFLLDLSGSMNRYYSNASGYSCDMPSGVSDLGRNNATEVRVSGGPSYRRQWCQGSNGVKYYDRITRVKDGMMDLLYGNPELNIQALTNDKVIGLSTFSGSRGFVQVPARRLDAMLDGQTQRQILIETIGGLSATGGTPTARAYAEVGAYMLGTTTLGVAYSGALQLFAERQQWKTCRSWASDNVSCTDWRQGPTGSSTSWNSSSPTNPNPDDMTTFNCSVGGDTATCFREETTSTVTTNTIAYKRIGYAYRTSGGVAGGRRWKTCTNWAATGNPRACTKWSPEGTSGTGNDSWSATTPSGWNDSMASQACPSGVSGSHTADCYVENVYQTIQQPINREYYARKSDWKTCNAWNSTTGNCSSWSSSWSNEQPANLLDMDTLSCSVSSTASTCYYSQGALQESNTASGFPYSVSISKHDTNGDGVDDRYIMPTSISNQINNPEGQQCSGQGIYVLTDGEPSSDSESGGLMTLALGDKGHLFNCEAGNSGWDCISEFTAALLDRGKNPVRLKYKTAVVGFGNSYNNLPSYNKSLSQAQNIQNLGTINTNVKRAARWGIVGEGGWYSGSDSRDVVNSVNDFIGTLSTEIPSVTTGSPTIPKDALNPAILQDDAYYQQFQPTPDKTYGLWAGNLKKYTVGASGKLQGRNNRNVHDSRGRLIEPTVDENGKLLSAVYDFWSYNISSDTTIADADETTLGSRKFAAKGGAWSQLKLRINDNVLQRKLLTNRVGTGTGAAASFTSSNNTLRTVNLDYLTDDTYKDDPERGYLIGLLGYNVDAANPTTISVSSLTAASELRQVGAVMHSLPVLVTNKGKVTYNAATKTIGSTNRDDYVLFGTTQGLLHVVDAQTGQEKFAFVPNEMVENQKEAFLNYTSTTVGVSGLYYGVDAPWTVHTEYVIDGSGNLTVGSGKGANQKGKQLAFGGLRMGGRSYYSLDLQNIDAPKLNFHINPDAATSGPLSYMGESWSKPSIGYVNWAGKRKLVMFVGGGYDRGYENHNYNQANKKGAGVYMFSAEGSDAGSLLWWSSANAGTSSSATKDTGVIKTHHDDLKYSVVGEIRTVDRDGDDLVDHLYFGDLGGQVFRIDLNNKATKLGGFARTPVRLLDLNNAEKSPRFYDMPSFSIYNEKGDVFAVISVGSGNRSQPLQSYTEGATGIVNDAIYNIYDKDVARKDLYTASKLNTQNIKSLALLTEDNRYSNTTPVAPYSTNGWYYQFNNCVAGSDGTREGCNDYKLQSEKVFGTPLAMNYRLYVSTFDSSKPGISGNCGAGVKGESFMSTFCMPFGQCKSKDPADGGGRGEPIGIGIQNITTGNDKVCVGEDCDDQGGDGGSTEDAQKSRVASSSNYCANTGGRILVTTTGAGGVGQETQMCLIPQRWYEKNSLIR